MTSESHNSSTHLYLFVNLALQDGWALTHSGGPEYHFVGSAENEEEQGKFYIPQAIINALCTERAFPSLFSFMIS